MDHPFLEQQRQFIVQVKTAMSRRNIDARQLSETLGISYSHVVGILAGDRQLGAGNTENIRKFAQFLGVPVLQVFVWSGVISPEDCVVNHGLKEQLALSLRKMELDPMGGILAPRQQSWDETPVDVQLAFIMMYELYSRKTLLEHAQVELPPDIYNKPLPDAE